MVGAIAFFAIPCIHSVICRLRRTQWLRRPNEVNKVRAHTHQRRAAAARALAAIQGVKLRKSDWAAARRRCRQLLRAHPARRNKIVWRDSKNGRSQPARVRASAANGDSGAKPSTRAKPAIVAAALSQSALTSTGLPIRGVITWSPTLASIQVSWTPASPAYSRPSAASTCRCYSECHGRARL